MSLPAVGSAARRLVAVAKRTMFHGQTVCGVCQVIFFAVLYDVSRDALLFALIESRKCGGRIVQCGGCRDDVDILISRFTYRSCRISRAVRQSRFQTAFQFLSEKSGAVSLSVSVNDKYAVLPRQLVAYVYDRGGLCHAALIVVKSY